MHLTNVHVILSQFIVATSFVELDQYPSPKFWMSLRNVWCFVQFSTYNYVVADSCL